MLVVFFFFALLLLASLTPWLLRSGGCRRRRWRHRAHEVVYIGKSELAELVVPVPQLPLVLDQDLLVLLELIAHLDLDGAGLVELARLLVQLGLEVPQLLLLRHQLLLCLVDVGLQRLRLAALVLDFLLEHLELAVRVLQLLGRLPVVLLELHLGLLRFGLLHFCVRDLFVVGGHLLLDRVDLGALRTELLTTDFHDLVLELLDLRLDVFHLGVKLSHLLVQLGNLSLEVRQSIVVRLGRLVLLAQLLYPPVGVGEVLLGTLDLEADLLHLGVELRNPLIQLPEPVLELSLLVLEFLELLLDGVTVFLELGDMLLSRVRHKLARHATLPHRGSTAGHGTALVDERPVKSDDTPPLGTVRDPVSLCEVLGHQGILQGMVEGRAEFIILGIDEVEETRRIFRCLDGIHPAGSQLI